MRVPFLIFFYLLVFCGYSQAPIYDYLTFEKTLQVPKTINSERTAVVVQVPDEIGDFHSVGGWEVLSERAHKAFVKMGVDAIFYLNHYALTVSTKSKLNYQNLFEQRRVKNIIFLTQNLDGYEIVICQNSGTTSFVSLETPVFYYQSNQLYDLLLQVGKEIKRADYEIENFLIPERPNFVPGISIVEKSLLKNY